jgi:tRNA (cmo5U34)-methyltransferase
MFESDNSTPHSAATYDAQVRNTIPYYNVFHEQTINLIKAMDLQPRTWLDTGCGTGALVHKATKEFSNTQFTLVDPSGQMLDAAKNKLAKHCKREILRSFSYTKPCFAKRGI